MDAVVVEAVRTPQTKKDGELADVYPEDLVITVLDALRDRSGINPERWDGFRLGCANQENEQGRNLARQSLLAGGYPEAVPAATINRLCGSSMTALIDAARAIESKEYDIVPIAGVEHMSRVPFSDWLHPDIEHRYQSEKLPMGQTAETIARQNNISRTKQDKFALRSHKRAIEAWETGRFDTEVVPVETDEKSVFCDENPRPDTTLKDLQNLSPVFRDDEAATVTAGNASPLTDGAAGVLVVSEQFAKDYGLSILGTVETRATVGVDPYVMGKGPVPASRQALDRKNITIDDIDVVELNEAFASQTLYCKNELGIDDAKLNPNGGAIALGHPLGCSGARITTTLLHELNRRNSTYGLATMCVGFGQGVAMVFST
ncbi:MAG: acetyl-CoA C-acyltransferase [Halobacteriaceae archaeon]